MESAEKREGGFGKKFRRESVEGDASVERESNIVDAEKKRTVKNDGKPSQICSRKRLGSVTKAPWLGFSSWK